MILQRYLITIVYEYLINVQYVLYVYPALYPSPDLYAETVLYIRKCVCSLEHTPRLGVIFRETRILSRIKILP